MNFIAIKTLGVAPKPKKRGLRNCEMCKGLFKLRLNARYCKACSYDAETIRKREFKRN